ncbi:MAG: amino acid ABC transporter ATP-binding protein [Christensenellales bacterium]
MAFFEVNNMRKDFGATQVLKGVSFEMEKGQVVAIIGSSGSGKTTLLRCINFLVTPDAGSVKVGDNMLIDIPQIQPEQALTDKDKAKIAKIKASNLAKEEIGNKVAAVMNKACKKAKRQWEKNNKLSEDEIRNRRLHMGMVFQSFNLFPHYNVLDNVTLAVKLRAKENKTDDKTIEQNALELLEKVGLKDKINNYPCELSGGQQQRVAIARALALKPDVLCFDEPTSALDPELTGEVLKVIKGLKNSDSTMIVVTHEMEFARKVADKVIYMSDGIIEEQGTPEEIFGNPKSDKTRAFLQKAEEVL